MVIKSELGLLSWFQPRKNNCVPTELDVSILALLCHDWLKDVKFLVVSILDILI